MIPFLLSLTIAIVACVSIICRFSDIVLRTGLIIVVVTCSLISFWLITLYAGKPKESDPPADMIVYGHVVDMKNLKQYILFKNTGGDLPPTLIELPYSKELGKALKQGTAGAKGKPFRMKKKGEGEGGDGEGGEGDGTEEGENSGGSLSNQSQSWELMPLPPPRLPQKNTSEKSKDSA